MKLIRSSAGMLAALVLLAACAAGNMLTPKTYGETMIYGYTTNAQVRRGAAVALNAKTISKEDASHVLNMTDTSRRALDEFRKAGCPAYTSEPKSSDKPACLSELPATTIEKLHMAVRLADQAAQFLIAIGGKKE